MLASMLFEHGNLAHSAPSTDRPMPKQIGHALRFAMSFCSPQRHHVSRSLNPIERSF